MGSHLVKKKEGILAEEEQKENRKTIPYLVHSNQKNTQKKFWKTDRRSHRTKIRVILFATRETNSRTNAEEDKDEIERFGVKDSKTTKESDPAISPIYPY